MKRLFWLSLAALFSAASAAPGPAAAESASATNIVFPGRTNEEDSQRRGPPAATVDTKEVREQGREKLDGERGITDILDTVAWHDERDGGGEVAVPSGCICTPLTYVDKYSRINGDCRTAYRGQNWCYISEDSDCTDAKRSRKFPILKWSHSACDPEFPPVVQQPPLPPPNPPKDIGLVIRPRGAISQTHDDDDDQNDDVIEGGERVAEGTAKTMTTTEKKEPLPISEDEVVFDP